MNFKTTIILLVLLLGGLAFVYFANREPKGPEKTASVDKTRDPNGSPLVDIKSGDINKLSIRTAGDQLIELVKSGEDWSLTEPLKAAADGGSVGTLLRNLTALRTRGKVPLTGDTLSASGLSKPQYTLEATTSDGKKLKLEVGNRSALGNDLYVKLNGASEGDLSTGGALATQLEQGTQKLLTDLRDKMLVRLKSGDEVKQIAIDKDGKRLVLHDVGKGVTGMRTSEWKIVEPVSAKADASDASSLARAATGLRADSFVSASSPEIAAAEFEHPRFTVSLSTAAPSTQPAGGPASQPSGVTLTFGQFADLDNKQTYVRVSDTNAIAKVTLSEFDAKTLGLATVEALRDRNLLEIKPAEVSRIVLKTDIPAASQPTTRQAKQTETIIQRHKQSLIIGPELPHGPATTPAKGPATSPAAGPAPAPRSAPEPTSAPTTRPATGPHAASAPVVKPVAPVAVVKAPETKPVVQPVSATQAIAAATQAATLPSLPAHPTPLIVVAPWDLLSGPKGDADTGQVDALLKQLNPLKVEKYLASPEPTTQPLPRYTLDITTEGPGGSLVTHYVIKITDPGGEKPLLGEYNGLTFELSRELLKNLEGDFKTPSPAAATPDGGPPNDPSPFHFPGR